MEGSVWAETRPMGEGWRVDLNTRRWDRRKSQEHAVRGQAISGLPTDSRRPTGLARGVPHARKQKPRADLHSSHVLSPGAGLLVTERLSQTEAGPGQPEATYSSRASQLRAALARGAQTDVFTPTSLRTGVFTLGRRTRGKHM